MSSAEGDEVRELSQDLGLQPTVQKLVLNHSQRVSATARELARLMQK